MASESRQVGVVLRDWHIVNHSVSHQRQTRHCSLLGITQESWVIEDWGKHMGLIHSNLFEINKLSLKERKKVWGEGFSVTRHIWTTHHFFFPSDEILDPSSSMFKRT